VFAFAFKTLRDSLSAVAAAAGDCARAGTKLRLDDRPEGAGEADADCSLEEEDDDDTGRPPTTTACTTGPLTRPTEPAGLEAAAAAAAGEDDELGPSGLVAGADGGRLLPLLPAEGCAGDDKGDDKEGLPGLPLLTAADVGLLYRYNSS
jgi:hypothetical protein